ncbi:hypothetical protein PG993_012006 [Apiospora rasikravindrae]|uniref:F-box domain-containing protein n=1 Tax=Apiospora rasikravindrae TaxID=990691 RepID=A0ABR1S1A0_9PEZI
MDRLPPEIMRPIVQMVIEASPSGLVCAYAGVSRQWQAMVEQVTFATLRLNQERILEAGSIMSPVRQSYVRSIIFTAKLFTHEPEETETDHEKRYNNIHFSNAVTWLLEYLRTWSGVAFDSSYARGIALTLAVASPSDAHYIDLDNTRFRLPLRAGESRTQKCLFSIVGLQEDFTDYRTLPTVPFITSFRCKPGRHHDQRRLVPKSLCEIASRFPNLLDIDWDLPDGGRGFSELFRNQLRRDFATALPLLPRALHSFKLCYGLATSPFDVDGGSDRDETEHHQPRLGLEGTPDELSVALGQLAMRLRSIEVTGIIGNEFFTAIQGDPEKEKEEESAADPLKTEPSSRLHQLILRIAPHTPQGAFLFDHDPLDPSPEVGWPPNNRVIPVAAQIHPYILAAARAAAARLPALTNLVITWKARTPASLTYTVRSVRKPKTEAEAELVCNTSPALDLPDELQEAWWHAAQSHLLSARRVAARVSQFRLVVRDNGLRYKHLNDRFRHLNDRPGGRAHMGLDPLVPVAEPPPHDVFDCIRNL